MNGQLDEYLLELRKGLDAETTEQAETLEKMFRFGIGVVRGMEYLARRNVG